MQQGSPILDLQNREALLYIVNSITFLLHFSEQEFLNSNNRLLRNL